jgi:hypothetical protein
MENQVALDNANSEVIFQTFPKSMATPITVRQVVEVFKSKHLSFNSKSNELNSNSVLAVVREELESLGFQIEKGKSSSEKIKVPVLYGLNGSTSKTFDADGFHPDHGIVLEVEAGRAVVNYQFLKDLFQACAMQEAKHLVIAVRNTYKGSRDFSTVIGFMETLYASSRLILPLASVTIIGY